MPNDQPTISDLAGIYKEIAEIIDVKVAISLHDNFQGQQITFPKKLFTWEYILKQIKEDVNADIKTVAFQYGYTERHIRQMIKEQNHTKIT